MEWYQLGIADNNLPEENKPVQVCIKDLKEECFYVTSAHRQKESFYIYDFVTSRFVKLKKGLKVTHWKKIEIPS